ncbi:MAG TPA: peptidase M23 [Alphaproteobacteria bacterium]|nr:peptidase M23 [Alphaproteobacteria bacterium]
MIRLIFVLCLASFSARAESPILYLHGQPRQGEMLFAFATPKADVSVNGVKITPRKDGWFVVGIGRNDTGDLKFTIKRHGRSVEKTFKIQPRAWKIQRIDGLPENKVNPSPEESARIEKEFAATAKARDKKVKMPLSLCFQMPAEGRISSVYGSQRILNGEEKTPHNALDIAAATGTPVFAPADAKVTLAYDEMFLTGKTVLLAHGQDVTTSYSHLSKLDVKTGDKVEKGQKIGEIGSTGRATGPHLHWVAMWRDKRVDPAVFIENSKAFCE